MNMSTNLKKFEELDEAFNRRDWLTYDRGFAGDFVGRNTRFGDTKARQAHLDHARAFCATFGDAHVHNAPYVSAVADGEWTCTVARFTGTMDGPFSSGSGKLIPPTGKSFDILLANFARWKQGTIVEEIEFLDENEILRQAGIAEA